MTMTRAPAVFLLLATSAALAGEPRFTDIVVSDSSGGPAKSTFTPNTPKVHVDAKIIDAATGSTARSEWIAEKVVGAPPNYKIDAADLKVGPLMNKVNFSFSKPNNGWPIGDYRVDLFINNKPAGQARFKVAK